MATTFARRALVLGALALASGGCSVTTEPTVILDCSTLAQNAGSYPDLVTTPSGLRYRDVVVGPGREVTEGSRVITYYSACLGTGDVFSQVNSPSRFIFTVGGNQVTAGLDEGVRGMRLGGRRQLIIPRELGFNNGDYRGFPVPNETFYMTIDAVGLQ